MKTEKFSDSALQRQLYRFEQDARFLDFSNVDDRRLFETRIHLRLTTLALVHVRQICDALGVLGRFRSKWEGARMAAKRYIAAQIGDQH